MIHGTCGSTRPTCRGVQRVLGPPARQHTHLVSLDGCGVAVCERLPSAPPCGTYRAEQTYICLLRKFLHVRRLRRLAVTAEIAGRS